MALSLGKKFEQKLKEDFLKVGGSFIYRLPDQVTGHKFTSANISDFIAFVKPNIFLIEVKTISGNTFPFSNFSQYEKLLPYKDINGLRVGVVIWFTERDRVIYVPLKTIEKMKQDDKKSINIKTIDTEPYEFISIPSVKKRTFMNSDYSVLCNLPEGW